MLVTQIDSFLTDDLFICQIMFINLEVYRAPLNFGIELSSQKVSLKVLSSIYNVSPLSSGWISVGPFITPKTPKQKVGKNL